MSEQNVRGRAVRARWGARLASTMVAATVAATLFAPVGLADTLGDLNNQVNDSRKQQEEARRNISSSQGELNSATSALIDSQNRLAEAQAILADIQVELMAAHENDARLAAELEDARRELELAKQRVAKAEQDVAAQVALIGSAARESFQQQTNLRELTVVFGSESPADLSQRLQWNTTIFDTQAAEKTRLDEVLAELEAAKRAQAEIEARIAAQKAESEQNVARITQLERAAADQQAAVQRLVVANESARAAAQGELDADEASYRTLQADEERLQREIQDELARLRAEEERRQREEQERRDAEERRREEERRNAPPPRNDPPSRNDPAPREEAPQDPPKSKPGPRESAWGFIRPVNARYGSPFGRRFHPILKYWRMHNGVDMGAPTGTPIYASRGGTVLKSGPNGGYGNFILIGHGDVINGKYTTTGYAHNSRNVVRVGQRVERGQLIGYVGSTGLSTAPHLHFEVRINGTPVNPVNYVP